MCEAYSQTVADGILQMLGKNINSIGFLVSRLYVAMLKFSKHKGKSVYWREKHVGTLRVAFGVCCQKVWR